MSQQRANLDPSNPFQDPRNPFGDPRNLFQDDLPPQKYKINDIPFATKPLNEFGDDKNMEYSF